MLLAIDVGNSHTVIGLFDGDELRFHWRVGTSALFSNNAAAGIESLFKSDGVAFSSVSNCCISSVVPEIDGPLGSACEKMFAVEPLKVECELESGIDLDCDDPNEVGADRIVNMAAAVSEYGTPLIVIDFGTATTFDAITSETKYIGGVIAPGIKLCASALAENCAKLPLVEICKPERVIGKNTEEQMQASLTFGYAGLVTEIVGRMKTEMCAEAKVVATGGLADSMKELLDCIDAVDPHLTLKGLRRIHELNYGKTGE